MKEKRNKEKRSKKKHQKKTHDCRSRNSSSTNTSDSEEWIEKVTASSSRDETQREQWMSMTGVLKTYTKEDKKPKRESDKRHIDSYNPSTSSRELNPYWKDGGTGLPQSSEEFRKSRPFLKPTYDDSFYTKSSSSKDIKKSANFSHKTRNIEHSSEKEQNIFSNESYSRKSYGWRKDVDDDEKVESKEKYSDIKEKLQSDTNQGKQSGDLCLSDDKMNKLAAKIVKAEIMGDTKLVIELKEKLELARELRKKYPNAAVENNDSVMLISTNSTGNSMPLTKVQDDSTSKGGKRKVETHTSGQRMKYFGNDDKYNLAQMFQHEKYSTNYDDEAQLAKIAAKHRNPNDDLEDIFVDEISKNRNETKESEREKLRAINQHVKMERSLDGCEYCVDSKNMLKHLIVSCGSKVYVALPAKKSLVKGHCIITTIQHNTCVTALDEDVWEEILNYRKALTQLFNSQNKDILFYETAIKLHRYPHIVINCVPLPRDVGDMAEIYFKKALLECEAEWSMNKKVVELKGKNIRKGIPKGLPYFWIDFGMDPGFAHVIEDQQLFPKTFAEEIIAGILDIDHNVWKNPQKEYGDVQRKKVLEFLKEWKLFDPTIKNKDVDT